MQKNKSGLKLTMKIAVLLVAKDQDLLDEFGGQRLLIRLSQQPLQVVKIAMEKADSLRNRPWDFKSLWADQGTYLNRYQPPRSQARPRFQERIRGYRDKGSAASVSVSARRVADYEGNTHRALEELTYYSTEYETRESDRWFDLLFLGSMYHATLKSPL